MYLVCGNEFLSKVYEKPNYKPDGHFCFKKEFLANTGKMAHLGLL